MTLSYKGKSCSQPVYVVRELQQNLLGLPAIQALNLLTQADTLQKTPVHQQFPAVFTGLGTIQDSFEIKLKPDAQPHALFTPRNVPIPLHKKVQDELARMESLGVISRVEDPTPWCTGMVVVPKKSGSVRMCGLQTLERARSARSTQGLPIQSAMSQGSFFTRQTPFHVPQLDLRMAYRSRRRCRQSSSQVRLYQICQPAKTALMSTIQLSRKTVSAASSSPSANRGGQTDARSREIYLLIGRCKVSSPFTRISSCTTDESWFPRACKP